MKKKENSNGYNKKQNKQTINSYSIGYKKYLKKENKKKFFVLSIQIGILIIFLGLWELLTQTRLIDPFIFSSPSRIVKTIALLAKQDLFHHVFVTLYETILGFIISTFLGTIIAILLWLNETIRRALEPYLVVLNSLPKIALGPIILIWFGSGTLPIVIMCVLICIVMTTISMLNSFISVNKEKLVLMKSMGANKSQILTKLVLPYSLPNFISVLKVNVGLAWVGSIMGEYISSSAGLGYLIILGKNYFDLDLVMSCIVILCLLAALMYMAVAYVEKRVKRR